METTTEPMATEPATNGVLNETSLNSTDAKAKRKSVSFVDEKLIMDALNSTAAIPNGNSGANGKPSSKPHYVRSNSDKPNGAPNNAKSQSNGRGSGGGHVPSSNGKRYPNGAANGHSKGTNPKAGANHANGHSTNGAAKNNAVIVYYNDPQATEIDVDQLLTKPVVESPKSEGNKQQTNNNKANFVPKAGLREPNGQHNHYQNGKHAANGAKATNSNGHQAKFAENWRQPKGLRMDLPQYNQVKTINGHSYNGGNNGAAAGKPNGKPYSLSPKAAPANGKTNGTFEKKVTPKSEPITIYYSSQVSSEEIEQNLKQLQLKDTQMVAQTNGDNNSEKHQQSASGQAKEETAADGSATESSQANVINGSPRQEQSDEATTITKMDVDAPIPPAPVSGDQYDVISGGVPIEATVLPVDGAKHAVLCTLVSHPGHFYVKFVNAQHDAELANMNNFYNSDEHIDLSVDVLKAGQYFAAVRSKASDASCKEWIRVQLLHVESPDLINCLLIDEGCFGVFKISDLQPLYNQFRSVPKQAIRASLAGVIPKEIDWLPKQALEFKSLVTDRQFHTGQQQFDQKAFDEKQTLEIELYFTEQNGGELADKSVADIVVERDIASKK